MNIDIIVKAIAAIQNELKPFEEQATEDGPYLMIWPHQIEVIGINGETISVGQALEEVVQEWDDYISP